MMVLVQMEIVRTGVMHWSVTAAPSADLHCDPPTNDDSARGAMDERTFRS